MIGTGSVGPETDRYLFLGEPLDRRLPQLEIRLGAWVPDNFAPLSGEEIQVLIRELEPPDDGRS